MRLLQQDACTIAGLGLRTARAPVVQVLQRFESQFDDFVAGTAIEIGHRADPATGQGRGRVGYSAPIIALFHRLGPPKGAWRRG